MAETGLAASSPSDDQQTESARVRPSFTAVIAPIAVLDIVFSLDSVITAVGMADEITIMVTAVIWPSA